jgi:hypothetical protein
MIRLDISDEIRIILVEQAWAACGLAADNIKSHHAID